MRCQEIVGKQSVIIKCHRPRKEAETHHIVPSHHGPVFYSVMGKSVNETERSWSKMAQKITETRC